MARPRVLLDTNVLVSGIVFKGNEHEILRSVERGKIKLVLPEIVLIEAKKVLAGKFAGFEKLLDLFLEKVRPELVPLNSIMSLVETNAGRVRDTKDAPIYSSVLLSRPDYAITGDKLLLLDLRRSREIIGRTKICSSKEFLQQLHRATM